MYATYNCKAEGDLHEEYYRDRAKEWPATHMRKEVGDLCDGGFEVWVREPDVECCKWKAVGGLRRFGLQVGDHSGIFINSPFIQK